MDGGPGRRYPISDGLSIRSELLYARYAGLPVGGGGTINAAPIGPMVQALEVRSVGTWTTRLGLNWKLGGFAAAPVVAKY